MCIRDRSVTALGELTPRGRDLILSFGERLSIHLVAAALNAVSYTHLRAHETVLDLVCRLLLEKKTHIKAVLAPRLLQQRLQDI